MRFLSLALLALLLAGSAAAPFDAEGYRTERYRAPVNRDPLPAARMVVAQARRLESERTAIFVDVMPAEGGIRDETTGEWKLAVRHQTIPGALWYPETGRAAPDPVLWRGIRGGLAARRKLHPAAPIVVFCRADCWMSWNAARRLAREGVGNVWWLAEGIDGWHAAGGRLVEAEPIAVPGRAAPLEGER